MRRILCVLLSLLMVCLCVISARAETDAYGGLEVSIQTKHDTYARNEPITATITIENTNYYTIFDITLKSIVPKGYALAERDSAQLKLEALEAGACETLKVTFEPLGFFARMPVWLLIAAAAIVFITAAAVIILLSRKKRSHKQVVALLLCLSILLPLAMPIRGEAAGTDSFDVSTSVDVGRKSVTLEAKVTYAVGLPSELKALFGLTDSNGDFDDDGIPDELEVLLIGSDPLVADGDQDADGDLLTNREEVVVYGTNPAQADTDLDTLSDGHEIKELLTDPLLMDTDGDGIPDNYELTLRLSPLAADDLSAIRQTAAAQDMDAELLVKNDAIPGITGHCDQVLSDVARLYVSNDQTLSDNRAIVGKGVRLQMDTDTPLTLTFDVADPYAPLTIMRRDEEGGWTILETENDDNMIWTEVSEGGTYCVADLNILLPLLGINVNEIHQNLVTQNTRERSATYSGNARANSFGIMGQADIVFVVDTTGSMSDEINNVANNISVFVQRLTTEYNVNVNFALIDYRDLEDDGKDSTRIISNGTSNWFADPADYANTISALGVGGGGDTPESVVDALETARRMDFRAAAKKFIILVTDANYKTGNNYGITSMDEEISLLSAQGIITSVVTRSKFHSVYESLYSATGGLFADIYGDFSAELLKLADLIGAASSDGNWILLEDFTHVALENPLGPDSGDTDRDGRSDHEELGEPMELNMTAYVKQCLLKRGLSQEMVDTYFASGDGLFITVYPYSSNPVLPDTDFDGISDLVDTTPLNSTLSADWTGSEYKSTITYAFDYRNFFSNNTVFNRNLSEISLLFSTQIYPGGRMNYTNTVTYDNPRKDAESPSATIRDASSITQLLNVHGFEDVVDFSLDDQYTDDDISQVALAHHTAEYLGRSRKVIAIIIRGTNSSVQEWSSNFHIGDPYNDDWENEENHRGFDVTAKRVLAKLDEYLKNHPEDADTVFWVTGHSRGAAIANIVAADLVDSGRNVYAYTFATPNTTVAGDADAARYDCIFNIVNNMDFVPRLPLEYWHFTRYGQSAVIAVTSTIKKEINAHYQKGKYNELGQEDMEDFIGKFEGLADSWADCYRYTCSCHSKSGSDNSIREDLGTSYSISDRAMRFCKIEESKNVFNQTVYTGCQVPAYFMQVLAEVMPKKTSLAKARVLLKYELADKYQWLRADLAMAAGGIVTPHYCETYYVLNRHVSDRDFT